MREDYNFVIKITTNCPAHCKCCVNRKKAFENKNENTEDKGFFGEMLSSFASAFDGILDYFH